MQQENATDDTHLLFIWYKLGLVVCNLHFITLFSFSSPNIIVHWAKHAAEQQFKLVDMSKIQIQSGQYGVPGSLLQAAVTLCSSESCVCVFGTESSKFSWASDSDKAACLLPLYVIFMDLTSSQGLESVHFGDIRVPSLLFFNDVIHEASTHSHFWCALEQFVAERDVRMIRSTSKFEDPTLSPHVHMGRISTAARVLASTKSALECRYLDTNMMTSGKMVLYWIVDLINKAKIFNK